MDAAEEAYRDALVEHRRRLTRARAVGFGACVSLVLARQAREAWAAGDGWTLASVGTTVVSIAIRHVVDHRRAERAVDDQLRREAQAREAGERIAEQRRVTGRPVGVLPPVGGCLPGLGVTLAGSVQAVWDYTRRPDAGRPVRWRPRPGPAWWTAWSWQGLPVNAASTAPRARQIAYERRQIVTLRSTAVAGRVLTDGDGTLRRGLADREWPVVAARTLDVAAHVVAGVADHRSVPRAVERRRARRRRHEAAVAALVAARAAGRPGPRNPYRGEMLHAAVTAAVLTAAVAGQVHLVRGRPRRPAPGRVTQLRHPALGDRVGEGS